MLKFCGIGVSLIFFCEECACSNEGLMDDFFYFYNGIHFHIIIRVSFISNYSKNPILFFLAKKGLILSRVH